MSTRRDFMKKSGAAAVGMTLATSARLAGAAEKADGSARGEEIIRAKPALKERWSPQRSLQVLAGGGPGPTWPKSEIVTFVAEVDEQTSRLWLPPPLKPSQPAKATFFFAWYPMTKLGFGYNEAAVLLHATHEGKQYHHCTWMVVDDDTALILGREMLGFPKKMADLEVAIHSEQPTAKVARKGLPVFDVTGTAGQPISSYSVFPQPIVNVIGLPRKPAELLQASVDEEFHSGKECEFQVSVGPSDLDPLYRLGIAEKQQGVVVIDSFGAAGADSPGVPQEDLSGTPVSPAWLVTAYPFRAW